MGRVYDDAQEHRQHLPGDLPRKAGATHLGMFFAWCALRGHASDWHGTFDPERLERLKRREMTGRDYVEQYLQGRIEDEHLTQDARAFAEAYLASGAYFDDYAGALAGDLPSRYHVADAWAQFDRLVPVLDQAFAAFGSPAVPTPAAADEAPPVSEAEVEADGPVEPEPEPERSEGPEPVEGPAPEPVFEPEPERSEGPELVEGPVEGPEGTWTWEQTVRREEPGQTLPTQPASHERGAPPPLAEALRKRLAIKKGREDAKLGGGWVWVGLLVFLLLYGCGRGCSG